MNPRSLFPRSLFQCAPLRGSPLRCGSCQCTGGFFNLQRTIPLFLMGVLFLAVRPSYGEEILRIALQKGVSKVTVSSEDGIVVLRTDGKPLWQGNVSQLTIENSKSLLINGRPYAIREVVLEPRGSSPLLLGKTPFHGRIRIKRSKNLLVINDVGLENYLQGVVPAEIAPRWHFELLKVQAVISRTYALFQKGSNAGREYDLVASVQDQVYSGGSVSHRRTNAAIEATRGEVLTYEGEVIFAVFHSTSAGPTEDASERWSVNFPYLKGVSCPRDQESPFYQWKRSITLNSVEAGLLRLGFPLGTLATINPLTYSKAGRVLKVRILHSDGELVLSADDLRRAIGTTVLPSTAFTLTDFGKSLVFHGKGYGHGVGLCQWGAKVLAEYGFSYKEIVTYYYPGAILQPYSTVGMR